LLTTTNASSTGLTLGRGSSAAGRLYFANASNNFTTQLISSSTQAANLTFTLPGQLGAGGQALLGDGSGGMYWGTVSGSLAGGTNGTIPYWTSATTLGISTILGNGSVAGINATSSTVSFNVQGSGSQTPFRVASSTGSQLFAVGANGVLTAGTSSVNLTLASGMIDADAITLATGTVATTGTSSDSGLAVYSDGLSLLRGCNNGEVLRWASTTTQWECKRGTDAVNVVKAANENFAIAGTGLQNDNELFFTAEANTTYVFKFDLIVDNNNSGGPDWKAAILGPAASTCYVLQYGMEDNGTDWVPVESTDCTTPGTLVNAAVTGDGQAYTVVIQGRITTGATAGTVALQWAPNTSSAGNLSVFAGSRVTAQKAGGVDLAEMYYTSDISLIPGMLVSLDSSIAGGVKKTASAYDKNLVGVISTDPGLLLADAKTNATNTPVIVALAGRVPVRVSNENGEIKPGDLLTSSSIPGIAMRATKAGNIIGQAMTGLSNATGTVTMFIKPGFANGTDAQDLLARDTNASSTEGQPIATRLFTQFVSQVTSFASTTSGLSEILADRVGAALEIITPKVVTGEIATEKITSVNGNDITLQIADGKMFKLQAIVAGTSTATTTATLASFDTLGNGDFTGNLSAQDLFARGNLSVNNLVTVGTGGIQSSGDASFDGNFFVGTTSSDVFFANALTGRVNVGTSTGNATLYVQANDTDNPFVVASTSGASFFTVTNDGAVFVGQATSSATLSVQARDETNDILSIVSQANDKLFTITSSGNVGFGTSSPIARADVWGNLNVATGAIATLFVNTATGVVGIGNNGTAIDDEKLRVSGRIRATGFDVDSAADLAENFPAAEAVDPGTVVAFSSSTIAWNAGTDAESDEDVYQMSMVRKAVDGEEAVGIVSTNAGIVLGKRVANAVPVAFAGRVPVKVSLENGDIKAGDYLTVSLTRPGYAMKLTGDGKAIGRAMSDSTPGREKVLVLVDNGFQKLDTASRSASTTAMLTTGNVDLNANGVAIYNIKSLASANGTWSIDENGRIVAKELCVGDSCLDGAGLADVIATSKKSGALQVIGNYTYILNVKSNTLTVLDISSSAPILITTIALTEKVTSMSTSGNYLYLTNDDLSKIVLIDISNPSSPNLARTINTGTASSTENIAGTTATGTDPTATGTTTPTDTTAGTTGTTTDPTAVGTTTDLTATGTTTTSGDETAGGNDTSSTTDATATTEAPVTEPVTTTPPEETTSSPTVDPTATVDPTTVPPTDATSGTDTQPVI
jgi:hypothetical protein